LKIWKCDNGRSKEVRVEDFAYGEQQNLFVGSRGWGMSGSVGYWWVMRDEREVVGPKHGFHLVCK
jgi:hypothetical protein